jgi:hypothetical protein
MMKEKFTSLSNDEAAETCAQGFACMLAGAALAISLVSMNVIAIVASVAAADQSC